MAKKQLAAPTEKYLLALYEECKRLYSDDDEQIEDIRLHRELKKPVSLPKRFKIIEGEVRNAAIADETLRVAAMYSLHPPKCTITPQKPSDAAQTNATLREKFWEAAFDIASTRTPGRHSIKAGIDALFGEGGCWLKLLFTKDLWEERYSYKELPKGATTKDTEKWNKDTEEAKQKSGPPLTLICCNNRASYPIFQGGKLGAFLEVTKRPQSATFRDYRLDRDAKGNIVPEELGQPGDPDASYASGEVEFFDYIDATWISYMVVGNNNVGEKSGLIVQQWKHGYGWNEPPVVFAPGISMNHFNNRKVHWSIGELKKPLVEHVSTLDTIMLNKAALDAVPPLVDAVSPDGIPYGDDGAPDDTPESMAEYSVGQLWKLPKGHTLQPIDFPAVAQSLIVHIGQVKEDLAKLNTAQVEADIGSGTESGFAISQRLAELRIKHDPPAQNFEAALTRLTRLGEHLIKNKIKETVYVYSEDAEGGFLTLSPEDVAQPVNIKWRLDPERPSDQLIKIRAVSERLQNETMSIDQGVEELGDNPDEVRKGRMYDLVRKSPEYLKAYMATLFGEANRGELLETQEAEQIAATGVLPGMPPPGGGAPAGMGQGANPIPDMGALSMGPNGQGAAPLQNPVPGAGPGAVVPMQGAVAGVMDLGQ